MHGSSNVFNALQRDFRKRSGVMPRAVGRSDQWACIVQVLRLRISSAALRSDRTIAYEPTLRCWYCSGLALVLATTMEECRATRSALFGVRRNRKRVVYWLSLGGAMLILPTFCPDCNEPTMEVVEHRPNDSYEARCTACGCQTFGKISAELLITRHAVESTR